MKYIPLIAIVSTLFLSACVQQENNKEGATPVWIKDLIIGEESEPVANPPASLTQCRYKEQVVYYLPPRCCDIPSILYDENGNVICVPDGGLIGMGDGRCPDFFDERTACEVIWKDSRSSE